MGGAAAFLAMEFVEGMSLEALLNATGVMRVELAAPLIMQIARGLAAAHDAGVIHCDIKPANILLGKDGAVKVTDFGIARSMMRHTGNLEGTFGTPGYLPPEALGSKEFTPAADLFGVGAMFYELLTGTPPHAGRNAQETLVRTVTVPAVSVREKNKSVPPAIDEIILGLLEKAPENRKPASARELADALEVISNRNGWKWTAPPALSSGAPKPDLSEQATAAVPAGPSLG
jgi:serine/threonine protein kinase